ncbi:MAG: META domain-containing protein [Bacteroidales bacterium]|jgi:heat shock protein HslJ|nr:META domain-containing protein [Bacteroidales bacterium]
MKKHSLLVLLCLICGFWGCRNQGTKNPDVETANPADNSRDLANWSGLYFGTVPCADCSGIDIQLELNSDLTYKMHVTYQDREGTLVYAGNFTWNAAGTQIDLKVVNGDGAFEHFAVEENRLRLLTPQGEVIDGVNADFYLLKKMQPTLLSSEISNKYWKLVELNGKPVSYSKGMPEEAYIMFSPDSTVYGSLSCNTFNGVYALEEGNRIRFLNMVHTLMSCANMSIEKELLNVLKSVDCYSFTEDQLSLRKTRMAPLARFEAVYLH